MEIRWRVLELWLEGPGDQTICSKDSINTRRIHLEFPLHGLNLVLVQLEGTVCVIQVTLYAKMAMPDLQRYP